MTLFFRFAYMQYIIIIIIVWYFYGRKAIEHS